MYKIFIDTNIFLDLYRSNQKNDISAILKLIYDNKKYYITSQQAVNEFTRNRNSTIEAVLKDFDSKTHIDNGCSSFIRSLKSYGRYQKDLEKLKEDKKIVESEAEEILNDKNKDSIYKRIMALSKANNTIPLTEEIFDLAYKRKLSGNPPTSDKYTCGDELIWESLLSYGRQTSSDLIIVSRDATYRKNNDFLVDEYKNSVGCSLKITDSITDAYEAVGICISDAVKAAEDNIKWTDIIIAALNNLGGAAKLKDIYDEAVDILYFNDAFSKLQNKEKESTIRAILQRFSSDCPGVFNGTKDLFHQVGEGIWELR